MKGVPADSDIFLFWGDPAKWQFASYHPTTKKNILTSVINLIDGTVKQLEIKL